MQEKQKERKEAKNTDLEEFFNRHTVTEYEVDESQCTRFNTLRQLCDNARME